MARQEKNSQYSRSNALAMKRNRFGLSRDIPADVARDVRRRDGFGCVICGSIIVDYEHFAPEFKDAAVHEAKGICLMCPTHHSSKGRLLARSTIERAMANPKAGQRGFAAGEFDPGADRPTIKLGTVTFEDTDVILAIQGQEIIGISPPEEPGAPFRINARIRNAEGKLLLEIVQNEIRTPTQNWDSVFEGNIITLRSARYKVALVLRSEPGVGLIFERLDLNLGEYKIRVREGKPVYVEIPATGVEVPVQTGWAQLHLEPRGGALEVSGTTLKGFFLGLALAAGGIGFGRVRPGDWNNSFKSGEIRQVQPRTWRKSR